MRRQRKETVENCRAFNLTALKSKLPRGTTANDISLSVSYSIHEENIMTSIMLAKTPCHFGGFRWWLLCPTCSRRVRSLYRPHYARYYCCRHCHDLTYIQRQLHKHAWFENMQRTFFMRQRLIKILEGVGQKGFSKLKTVQLLKLERRILAFTKKSK